MGLQAARKNFVFKTLSFVQAAIFIFSSFAVPATTYAQGVMDLPAPGVMVNPSMSYVPVMLRAVKINPDQPLVFDFIVDSGNTQADRIMIKTETEKLVKYFLASLTIPEKDLWVNLSPYERDRIVPEVFGQTEMGRDLLAQDYILKQLTASLVDPEKDLGREFWSRVYAKARETLGTTELPVDTFNKVWIMPDRAEVYEMNNTAIVGRSSLRVLMEEDYLALQKNMGIERGITAEADSTRKLSNDIMREVVLPEIEKEVNTGRNFALLRQVYQSLVLATWYKNNLKESLLAQVYEDQNKTAGVSVDKADKEAIYQRYIAAYKQGVFNYIKEDVDPLTNEIVPRKYFSGGAKLTDMGERVRKEVRKVTSPSEIPVSTQEATGDLSQVTVAMAKPDAAEIEKKMTPSEMLQGLSSQAKTELPSAVLSDVSRGVYTTEKQLQALNVLADVFQAQDQLINTAKTEGNFEAEDVPGDIILLKDFFQRPDISDANKADVMKELIFRDKVYPDGLAGYAKNGSAKNLDFKRGKNPFEGQMPEEVVTRDLTDSFSPQFKAAADLGVREARSNVYAMPVGGEGARLGAKDPRVLLSHNAVTGKLFLQEFIEKVLQAQNRSNKIAREKNPAAQEEKNPLILMTSDATHDKIVATLQQNDFFGMDGMTFVDVAKGEKASYENGKVVVKDAQGQYRGDLKQIVIVKQESVPSMFGAFGQFFVKLNKDKKAYELDVKPHNHGDLHMLIKMAGLAKAYDEAGFKRTVVFQDTNGEVFNALFPALGDMIDNAKKLNVVTVKLNPGDKVGTMVRFSDPKTGRAYYQNVEYNQREQVFGDQKVKQYMQQNGVSEDNFLSGNINVYVMDQKEYSNILDKTNGMVNEIVNPKAGVSRLEAMMQDIYMYFNDKDTEVSEFDPRFVFNAVKNGVPQMVVATSKGLFPEGMVTAESYQYVANRQMAERAGMALVDAGGKKVAAQGQEALAFPGDYTVETNVKGDVRVKGPFVTPDNWIPDEKFGEIKAVKQVKGVPYQKGARIVWSYLTPGEVQKNISGGSITDRSDLVIDGNNGDVQLRNVNIDGALELTAEQGAQLIADGLTVKNAGWDYVDIKPEDMGTVSDDARMRGVQVVKKETASVTVTQGRVKLGKGLDITGRVVVENTSGQEVDLGNVLKAQEASLTGEGITQGPQGQIVIAKNKKITIEKGLGQDAFAVHVTDAAGLTEQQRVQYKRGDLRAQNEWNQGGIDFNPAGLNLNVTRTGQGVQVQFDPAEIQRIKMEGVVGFTPVIINITPVKSMLPALGLVAADAAGAAV